MANGSGIEQARNVITWLGWIAMIGICAYLVIDVFVNFNSSNLGDQATKIVVGIYLVIFGVVGILYEIGQKHARKGFPFLGTLGGKGGVFFFSGTLALSWGIPRAGESRGSIIAPFVMALYHLFVAFFNWLTLCCRKEYSDMEEPKEKQHLTDGAGPNRI